MNPVGVVYHDGSAAARLAAERTGAHKIVDLSDNQPLAAYSYGKKKRASKNNSRITFLFRLKNLFSQHVIKNAMADEQKYKHLIVYPEDLNSRGKSKFQAMGRDVDEIDLEDVTLPDDWKMYEVIMFIDPEREESDKILWDKERQQP